MKKILILVFIIFSTVMCFAATTSDWFRYAAVSPSGEKVVFSYKGDLYIVSSKGGRAENLTFHNAYDFNPVWSSDSRQIAFASDRYGNLDVFVINADGGESRRLTFHSADEVPETFSPDNRNVLFSGTRLDSAQHRQFPLRYYSELYSVPVKGGRVDQVWTTTALSVRFSKSGDKMAYHDQKAGENRWRKHQVSSAARDIWIYDKKTEKHVQLIKSKYEERNPVFADNDKNLYFLSEKSGTFNVHKTGLNNPDDSEQITDFKDHPVRFLSISDNGTLCFTHNGDIYIKKKGGNYSKIDVKIKSEMKNNDRKIIPLRGRVSEMAVSPDGKEIAYIARGEVFVSSVKGRFCKRITDTPSTERFVTFSPDGKSIVFASERDAKWGIYSVSRADKSEPCFFASTVLKEEKLICNDSDNYMPAFSPDGKEIAYISDKRNLKIFNLNTRKTRTVLTGKKLFYMYEGDQYFTWSPDSKWLLVEYSPVLSNGEILLVKADTGRKVINLTESGYYDSYPKWVNKGKQMLWFSNRHGLRSYANSGSKQRDVYTMFFTEKEWDRFHLTKDEFALKTEIEKKLKKKKVSNKKAKKDKNKKAVKKPELLKFDWHGMKERKARLTIHSSSLSDAVLSKDSETLYYLAKFEKGYDLWKTKLRTKQTSMVIKAGASSASLYWDKEQKNLFMLADGRIYKVNIKSKSRKPVNIGGEIVFNESEERAEMFNHVWQRTNSMFYISDFHGVNWKLIGDNYKKKLQSVNNDRDFAELLSEMLGELNVSHSGAGAIIRSALGDKTASLGIMIDYAYRGEGLKIAEVLRGGPFDKSHLNIRTGMIIKSINGKKIRNDIDYASYLNRLAGKYTSVTVYDPLKKSELSFTVKPVSLRAESRLLYKRWVKRNEDDVLKMSGGKVGYVHIAGMSDGPYRNTYEKALGKYYDCDSLIVDTRCNRGGDLVGDITMFLTGKVFMTYAIESRDIGYEPNYRWTKPSVTLVNEANYSDGSCFACAYRDLGIGKIIGMPVPGTCSFASGEMMQNGTVHWGAVPVSAKDKSGAWMENNQTEPDIKVKNIPGFVDKGRDQQLETAVKVLLKKHKK